MSEAVQAPRARLDLDALAPVDKTLHLGGVDYPVRADIPVPMMIGLLRLEERIDGAKDNADVASAFADAYAAVMRLIRERTPDASDLDLSVEQVVDIMTFVAGGESGASVAQTVQEAISAQETAAEGRDAPEAGAGPQEPVEGAADPLVAAAAA